jgi:hypothetical protein
MKRIGIDQSFGDIYENVGNFWRVISPSPIISNAVIDPELPVQFVDSPTPSRCIFREDNIDPVARIRRGRFYEFANQQQPSQSWALPNPGGEYFLANRRADGLYERFLYTYDQYQLPSITNPPKFVAIGSAESLWTVVVRPERISTGEFLFVLRARHAFGTLPEVDADAIPERGRESALKILDKLKEAAHRESPGSIVDRAADAIQWCLATWGTAKFDDNSLVKKSMDRLIKAIKNKDTAQIIATDAANIIRVLHARGKPNAQDRHGTRPVVEDDAELALRAVGFVIREFGWAQE